MWQEGKNHRCAVALTLQKRARDSFSSLWMCCHDLNSAFNFRDFFCSSVLISKVTLQLQTLRGAAYTEFPHLELPRFCWDFKISRWIWFGFGCHLQNKLPCSNNPSGWLKLQISSVSAHLASITQTACVLVSYRWVNDHRRSRCAETTGVGFPWRRHSIRKRRRKGEVWVLPKSLSIISLLIPVFIVFLGFFYVSPLTLTKVLSNYGLFAFATV